MSVRDNWSVLGVWWFTVVCDVWDVAVLSQISSNDEEEKSRLLPGEW